MSVEYPQHSIQHVFTREFGGGSWWVFDPKPEACRGRLARAFVPFTEPVVRTLEPLGEEERYRVATQDARKPRAEPVQVLGLPPRGESLWGLQPCKHRHVLMLSEGGVSVARDIKRGRASKWRFAKTILVAPYFSVSGGKTAAFPEAFVEGARLGVYPQLMWDILPRGERDGSILRLDQLQPIGHAPSCYALTPWRLSEEALALVDEWVAWSMSGALNDLDGELVVYRDVALERSGQDPSRFIAPT